jgi:hypothetical protein
VTRVPAYPEYLNSFAACDAKGSKHRIPVLVGGVAAAQVLHNSPPEHPKTARISTSKPISHNNIRKTERFRNRQLTSSSLVAGQESGHEKIEKSKAK